MYTSTIYQERPLRIFVYYAACVLFLRPTRSTATSTLCLLSTLQLQYYYNISYGFLGVLTLGDICGQMKLRRQHTHCTDGCCCSDDSSSTSAARVVDTHKCGEESFIRWEDTFFTAGIIYIFQKIYIPEESQYIFHHVIPLHCGGVSTARLPIGQIHRAAYI